MSVILNETGNFAKYTLRQSWTGTGMSNFDRNNSRQPLKKIPIRVKRDPSGGWTLIPPHCVFELEPDMHDVEMLLKEGDFEEARDAALFILEECQDMTAAHLMLGKIAEKHMNDMTIAQGHYGYVFEMTLKWLGDLAMTPMNQAEKINRTSAECAEGLIRVLDKKGQEDMADQVARYLDAWKGQTTPQRQTSRPEPTPRPAPRLAPGPDSGNARPRPAQGQGGPSTGPPKRRPMLAKPNRNRPKPTDS
jgi:hypothetical protein